MMKPYGKLIVLVLLLVLAIVPTGAVHASGYQDGRVVFGDDFTLKAGQTLGGDLAVFGGDVLIEEGAVVRGSMAVIGGDAEVEAQASIEGDVAVIGGDLEIAGTVNGNLAIIGGEVSLGEEALVDGDIATMGGELIQSPGAVITGNVADNPAPSITIPDVPAVPAVPEVPDVPAVPGVPNVWTPPYVVEHTPFGDMMSVFIQAVGIGLIATLVALFLQPQLERVGQAITGQPVIAGSFGLLAVVVGSLALLVLGITIILLPVSFLGGVALILAWLFGLIAIGQEVGERFTRAVSQTWSPPLTTGFGSFLLILVGGSISEIVPCGFLAPILIGLVGLGGTALTIFGTRVYPQVALPPAAQAPAAE
jgi:hypothetical protein